MASLIIIMLVVMVGVVVLYNHIAKQTRIEPTPIPEPIIETTPEPVVIVTPEPTPEPILPAMNTTENTNPVPEETPAAVEPAVVNEAPAAEVEAPAPKKKAPKKKAASTKKKK